jgi:hypothetical protein
MALLSLTFFASFVPFLVVPIWVLVVSIRMARSNPSIT